MGIGDLEDDGGSRCGGKKTKLMMNIKAWVNSVFCKLSFISKKEIELRYCTLHWFMTVVARSHGL